MDKRKPFTDKELGLPLGDDTLFMAQFEQNLTFEKRRLNFNVTPWYQGYRQVLAMAAVFAICFASLGLFVSERLVIHAVLVVMVAVVACRAVRREFFSR